MGQCFFCQEPATRRCGLCETPVCASHQYKVNPWSNAYRAEIICHYCHNKRKKHKVLALFAIVLICAVGISQTQEIAWGLGEASTWFYFSTLTSGAVVIFLMAALYHLAACTGQGLMWLKALAGSALLWLFFYTLYRSMV